MVLPYSEVVRLRSRMSTSKPAGLEHLAARFDQPPALRHLARTGVLGARRAVDEQDARGLGGIFVASLRFGDRVARGEPVDRKIIIGIGKARPRLARMRRLAAVRIGIPCGVRYRLQFFLERVEGRIDEG